MIKLLGLIIYVMCVPFLLVFRVLRAICITVIEAVCCIIGIIRGV